MGHGLNGPLLIMCCKGCLCDFGHQGDLLSHQKQAKTCHWLYEEHQAQNLALKCDFTANETLEEDPPMEAENVFFTMEDTMMKGHQISTLGDEPMWRVP